jgi:hypothetical protein
MRIFQTQVPILYPQFRGYQEFTPALQGLTTVMSATTGSYALTGIAATFNITMAESVGSYILTGNAATLVSTVYALVGTGSYVLTGNSATLVPTISPIVAVTGAYALTGNAATLSFTNFKYRPPTKTSTLEMPWLSLVQQADPDWARRKHREVEYTFDGKVFLADPYVRGIYNGLSNVYPVGQPSGNTDPNVFGKHLQKGVPTDGWA